MTTAAWAFIVIFYVLILIPSISVTWVGFKMITRLGQYPSKTPAIQLSIMFKLIVIEVVSFTLLLTFFKVLVAE